MPRFRGTVFEMICTHCQTRNPAGAQRCHGCGRGLWDRKATAISPVKDGTPTPENADATFVSPVQDRPSTPPGADETMIKPAGSSPQGDAGTSPALSAADFKVLPEGMEVARRYRVDGLLGRGGMGTVYRVHDLELDRDIALKVISPDIADQPVVLERFKREIQLSSKVTHPNVLRVYDLGEGDGVKFVTMQMVEGEELAHLIEREGKIPAQRAAEIFRQLCDGLAAAHEQGVVHRDLKPQNILLDKEGKVYITDFGLAKSLQQSAMTQAGQILGTPFYMSPEQVKGSPVDNRSDIYSMGIILYEMATGKVPFDADSAYEVMIQRLQRSAPPIADLNPEFPAHLRKIAERCMATDPAQRYQSVQEILADHDSGKFTTTLRYTAGKQRWLKPALLALLVVILLGIGGTWLYRQGGGSQPGVQAPRSVLIADFENRTGDFVFDGTLEPELGIALEGASFISAYRRGDARRIAEQLQPGAKALDEELARLVAVREGVDFVTTGSIERDGDDYRLEVRCIDSATGAVTVEARAVADEKDEVLATLAELAARVRRELGDRTPMAAQLAAAETFTAGSLEAAHEYGAAQELQFAGDYDEAIQRYTKAIEYDPNLGRAYAGIAVIHSNQGQREEAEEFYSTALARIDRMSEREKFRTRGGYFLIVRKDPDKAIQEYRQLVEQFPADAAGQGNLALAYFYKRDMARALVEGRRSLDVYPGNVPQRSNVGLYAMYAGDFETAIEEQRRVLEMNPDFKGAYVGLALSQLANGQAEEAAATYGQLRELGGWGASVATLGLADIAMVQGRLVDALPLLESGIESDLERGSNAPAAAKLIALADLRLQQGSKAAALDAIARATDLSDGEDTLYAAARLYLEAGDQDAARQIAQTLSRRLEPDPRAYAKLIEGEIQMLNGATPEAIEFFEQARDLADSWIGRLLLGRAYLAAEAYPEADAELEACIRREGEATALFLNEVPSYRIFPPTYYYLGLALEGLGSPAAGDAFRNFLDLRSAGDDDPLVVDARRRLEPE